VPRDTPGFNVLRRIPMIGGRFTYEIAIEDLPPASIGIVGQSWRRLGAMQKRLSVRRLQMGGCASAWLSARLQMMCDSRHPAQHLRVSCRPPGNREDADAVRIMPAA